LTAVDINPGVASADDDWYDGVDEDCAGNHDYDADGDGYSCDASEDSACSGYDCASDGDSDGCDCDDAESAVNPGTWESYTSGAPDSVDQDCDGDVDYVDVLTYRHLETVMTSTTTEAVGSSMAGIGDVDGDGFDDFLVGAKGWDAGAFSIVDEPGAVGLFYGGDNITAASIDDADLRLTGPSDYSALGLGVGAVIESGGGTTALLMADSDAVYLLPASPSSGGVVTSLAVTLAAASSTGTRHVLGIESYDGGSAADWVTSDPEANSGGGVVYWLNALPTSNSTLAAEYDVALYSGAGTGLGTYIASGDIDGTGAGDVFLSTEEPATTSVGYLGLASDISGLSGLNVASSVAINVSHSVSSDGCGHSTAGSRSAAFIDLNDTGYDELVIGCGLFDDGVVGGRVYVMAGGAYTLDIDLRSDSLAQMAGVSGLDGNLGWDVSNAGDTDDDGYDDLLIGAPALDGTSEAGSAWLFYGRGGLSGSYDVDTKALEFTDSSGSVSGLGSHLAGVGNVDGSDGDDFLLWGTSSSGHDLYLFTWGD
jgi:hypothetical protein